MKIFLNALTAVLLFAAAGCVSYSYTGETAPAHAAAVPVYSDSGKISRPYQVLGVAVVSGNYQHATRDRMVEKLKKEAGKAGADAVLIVEQQVLPAGVLEGSRGQGFFTAFDYDDTNNSWGELYRDVDVTIGNIGKSKNTASGTAVSDYKRIIRAEFLRYKETAAPPVKK